MTREARNFRGELCPMPKPNDHYKVRETYANGMIELWACRSDFAVVYGLEMQSGLSHAQAASVLGRALMHFAQCEGKLD